MADDPTKNDDSDKKPNPQDDPDAGAKRALDAERKARRDAEKALADVKAQLQELSDKDKPDLERLTKENADLKQSLADRDGRLLRSEIAAAKGLSPAQAKRLVGASKEELEADADEILEAFPMAGAPKPPPSDRPKPSLRGGSDPSDEPEETDPRKLAEQVPRA